MKSNKLPSLISYVLALFLTFTIFGAIFCGIFLSTVANPQTIDNAILKSEYITPLKQEIYNKWDNLASICGMEDRSKLLALLTEEQIKTDSRQYFKNAYTNQTIDTSLLKEKVHNIISDYAFQNDWGIISKAELEQNINDLVNSCMDEYNLSVKVKLVPKFFNLVAKYKKVALIGLVATSILSVGIIIFIYFLQSNRKKTLFYTFSAFGGNGLLYLFLVLFIKLNDLINRIPVEASALYNLINKYLQDILNQICVVTVLLLIISTLVLVLYLIPNKKRTPS